MRLSGAGRTGRTPLSSLRNEGPKPGSDRAFGNLESGRGKMPPETKKRLKGDKTLLVTGGAGFIGSHLVRRALQQGHKVVNLDKLTYASNLSGLADIAAMPSYRFVKGDIADRALVRSLMSDIQPDFVFHLAAESHVDRSIDDPSAFITTNLVGTFEVLEAALAAWSRYDDGKKANFRFVHVSTDEVFGTLGQTGIFDETTAYDPSSPYAASKAGSDHLARAWCRTYGLPVIVTNCSNNYGPFQHAEKFIPTVIRSVLAGDRIPVYGAGRNVRDWIYVEDHVEGLLDAAETGLPGETYLFGGRVERCNDDLCRMICTLLDGLHPCASGNSHADRITYVQDRPNHDFRYAIDPTATEAALGWRARTSIDDGLRATVYWYLDHPEAFMRDAEELGRLGLARTSAAVATA
jgi:dTDP-glucose 4,6-dehydratase